MLLQSIPFQVSQLPKFLALSGFDLYNQKSSLIPWLLGGFFNLLRQGIDQLYLEPCIWNTVKMIWSQGKKKLFFTCRYIYVYVCNWIRIQICIDAIRKKTYRCVDPNSWTNTRRPQKPWRSSRIFETSADVTIGSCTFYTPIRPGMINMEPTNHRFRKENDLLTSMFMFQPLIFRGVSFGKKWIFFNFPPSPGFVCIPKNHYKTVCTAVQGAYKLRISSPSVKHLTIKHVLILTNGGFHHIFTQNFSKKWRKSPPHAS